MGVRSSAIGLALTVAGNASTAIAGVELLTVLKPARLRGASCSLR